MHRFMARARDGEHAERGFFMVWFALLFVTLMGFAALALEYNRWESIGVRAQKAADAAALAGAVFLPDNLPNASSTARATSSKNGFTDGTSGVIVATARGQLPNQLKVTITVPTKNPFGAIVGYGNSTIVRSATAEYQLPQNLGSPQNSYGNDPEAGLSPCTGSTMTGCAPQFWGNIFGPASTKDKGDAIQAKLCGSGFDNCNSSSTLGSPPVAAPNTNTDYDLNGYFYGIDVPASPGGALNVKVFDPGYVMVGDNCTDGNAVNSLNAAAALTAAEIPGYSGTVTPAVRYASGSASPYCNGDMSYYGDSNNNLNPWTTWTVRAPDSSGWDPTNNPIVCQAEFPGVFPERDSDLPNSGSFAPNHLADLLKQNTNYPGVSPAMRFNQFFRQWVTLCSVASPVQGTYFLQVQTGKKIDGTATPNAGGSNRFSIQAGIGGNFAASNGVRVYGNGKMGAYANATGADTRFFLTRILPGEAGKTLVLNFFDVGDAALAAGQSGTISILPPPDSNVVSGTFANCKYTVPPGNANGPPWGSLSTAASGCSVTNITNNQTPNFNGQWVTVEVPIPGDYDCDDTTATGCWTRLRFTFPNGVTVNDSTTWSGYVLGEPVRIIK
ncbi:MAG: pilus assembly protein TadG-related protein [Acidimicrobiia bacterium]